jgi:hypothetical protein
MKTTTQAYGSGETPPAKSKLGKKPPLFPARDEVQDGRSPSSNEQRSMNQGSAARDLPPDETGSLLMDGEGVETQVIVDAKGKTFTRVILERKLIGKQPQKLIGKQPQIMIKSPPKNKPKGLFRRLKQSKQKSFDSEQSGVAPNESQHEEYGSLERYVFHQNCFGRDRIKMETNPQRLYT